MDFIQKILGSKASPSPSPVPEGDDAGFADFAGAPDPSPTIASPSPITPIASTSTQTSLPAVPYTKWYRVWERTSPADFKMEAMILPFLVAIILVHLWGTRTNKRKAKTWIAAHAPILEQEYASVGFGGRKAPSLDSVQSEGTNPEELMKENAPNEFVTYATGRQNVAFLDMKLSLIKRYNPLVVLGEYVVGFLFESVPAPEERIDYTAYTFDGREALIVPGKKGEERKSTHNSAYDGFVWAVVNKDKMKRLRGDRYDVSLTTTKDHPKLPAWATVMSEANEITETFLTPDLIQAVHDAGDDVFEALIITDQPVDRPNKIDETIPKKRIILSLRVPSDYAKMLPIFQSYLRIPDVLVSHGRFRPEVMRKVRATRDEEIRKLKKVDDDEKAEERKLAQDKKKREEREAMLKSLSAAEQKKFLDKERDKEQKRQQKRRTMRA
ncbi:DUF1682-domain-containing protein [Venturia nashicola]|uniref:DUF1682-domain-containing protein n=1 Tax=Venturia nashicola TaxID=86259 RepID=A0A4Z1P7C8_9PEZI|nr:DUF1682-domain-containing protein [Venturia nashicola]